MNYGETKEIADLLYGYKIGDVTFSAALICIIEICEKRTKSEVTVWQLKYGTEHAKGKVVGSPDQNPQPTPSAVLPKIPHPNANVMGEARPHAMCVSDKGTLTTK